jgi:hypothetical protein
MYRYLGDIWFSDKISHAFLTLFYLRCHSFDLPRKSLCCDTVYIPSKKIGLDASNLCNLSFCIVGNTEILPDKFGMRYESTIVSGNIEEVFDGQKQTGLEGFLAKYSSDFIEQGGEYIEKLRERTRVFKMAICEISGKAKRE